MGEGMRSIYPGTVDLVILKTLTLGPMHGFGISRDIRARSGGTLELQDAALYQALHRMNRAGWIQSEWGQSENNRRAKFYALTAAGEQRLTSESRSFRRYVEGVFRVLDDSDPDPVAAVTDGA